MNPHTLRVAVPAMVAFVMLLAATASGDVILTNDFDGDQAGWAARQSGDGTVVQVEPGGRKGKCLHLSTQGGAAYYTVQLDAAQLRGRDLLMSVWAKLNDVKRGPREYSTAKLHIAQKVDGKIKNHATWLVGTSDWTKRELAATIDEQAETVTMDLAIQNADGDVWFDGLTLTDDRQP